MTDVQKFFTAGAILGLVFLVGKKMKESHSSFIDEELSDASGTKENCFPQKKRFKPNTWTRVGNNWIWVNGEGELVIDNQ